jgi:Protein of unknown function (DUF3540)
MRATLSIEKPVDSLSVITPCKNEFHGSGFVIAVAKDLFVVACKEGQFRCQKAIGCLIQPNEGDLVLVHKEADEIGWILSVLMRGAVATQCVVQLPSNSVVKTEDDAIHFSAATTTFDSAELTINASLMQVNCENTQFMGKLFQITAGTFKAVGQTFTSIADRITQYSHTYFRTTTGVDKTDAKQLEIRAEQLLRIKGDYTLIEGDSLVKTKGSQIHFG